MVAAIGTSHCASAESNYIVDSSSPELLVSHIAVSVSCECYKAEAPEAAGTLHADRTTSSRLHWEILTEFTHVSEGL